VAPEATVRPALALTSPLDVIPADVIDPVVAKVVPYAAPVKVAPEATVRPALALTSPLDVIPADVIDPVVAKVVPYAAPVKVAPEEIRPLVNVAPDNTYIPDLALKLLLTERVPPMVTEPVVSKVLPYAAPVKVAPEETIPALAVIAPAATIGPLKVAPMTTLSPNAVRVSLVEIAPAAVIVPVVFKLVPYAAPVKVAPEETIPALAVIAPAATIGPLKVAPEVTLRPELAVSNPPEVIVLKLVILPPSEIPLE
jgi:hypothetical protein